MNGPVCRFTTQGARVNVGLLPWAACVAVLACGPENLARQQLLIYVDTNAPVSAQVREGASLEASVDTLRIDLVSEDGRVTDLLDVVVPEPSSWPVSFGVSSELLSGNEALLRLRLFRAAHATRGENEGRATLEPERSTTIDRAAIVRFVGPGVTHAAIHLDAACFGVPAEFSEKIRTCVSGETPRGSAYDGLDYQLTEPPKTRVGSYRYAEPAACQHEGPSGARCIPGGFHVLGDASIDFLASDLQLGRTLPRRAVALNPFWMDEREISVGQIRQLLSEQPNAITPPDLGDAATDIKRACTWRGVDDASNDSLPANCITYAAADSVCRLRGGRLPTEAQWEYAATGRGRDYSYPWGLDEPECCTAVFSRVDGFATSECGGFGPLPVDHLADTCVMHDRSPDGIVHLGGNVNEFVRGSLVDYGHECFGKAGVLLDPVCEQAGYGVARGGDWSSGASLTRATFRHAIVAPGSGSTTGFRCVYPDSQLAEEGPRAGSVSADGGTL